MDIIPTALVRYYVSESIATTRSGFRNIADWVEVGQVESIDEFGDSSQDILRLEIGTTRVEHLKGVRDALGFNVVVAHEPLDGGQDILDTAAAIGAGQLSCKVQLPADVEDNIFFFLAIVQGSRLDIGGVDHVIRRSYSCRINSSIFIDDDGIDDLWHVRGTGTLSINTRQSNNAIVVLPGTGSLSIFARQNNRAFATLPGLGSLSVQSVSTAPGQASIRFSGAGSFSIDTTVPAGPFLLLRDGTSKLLLRDGVSRLKLGH